MRVVMVSCVAYRDAWAAFDGCFRKYWPGREYTVISDAEKPGASWCQVVADFAKACDEPVLLLQEDFLINEPVHEAVVDYALSILNRENVGAVRLYPCPGANELSTDPIFGRVARHSAYRISCQATIWRPDFLYEIARQFKTPAEFEIQGSGWASACLPEEVWALQRDVFNPWPFTYLCSGISRGKWTHDAVKLAESVGVKLDLSVREVA